MAARLPAVLVGLDWGTTSLRTHLLGADGQIIESRSSLGGILAEHKEGFEGTFLQVVGDWLRADPSLPVVASGMITSRNGWVETPYIRVPGGLDDLAASLVIHDGGPEMRIHFVCGMDQDSVEGAPDIMRGEETQIVGCMVDAKEAGQMADGLFVMPGTHSKWIDAGNGRLNRFDTYMTGEVFAVLKGHSILGRLMELGGDGISDGFAAGVDARLQSGASLLHQIFSARTLVIYDRLKPLEAGDYLSGLLIGEEVRAALSDYSDSDGRMPPVTIVGNGGLTDRYRNALSIAGVEAQAAAPDVAAKGQFAIARRAGLIG